MVVEHELYGEVTYLQVAQEAKVQMILVEVLNGICLFAATPAPEITPRLADSVGRRDARPDADMHEVLQDRQPLAVVLLCLLAAAQDKQAP